MSSHLNAFNELTIQLLRLADQHKRFLDFQREICCLIAQFTNACDVLLVLLEGDGWTSCRWQEERAPHVQVKTSQSGVNEVADLVNAIGDVEPSQSLNRFLSSTMSDDQLGNGEKNLAVRMLPLSWEDKQLGVLAIAKDSDPVNTEDSSRIYDQLAQHLSASLVFRCRRAALVEREKELAGLYRLFRLAEQPEISLEAILEKAAISLPAAWQFPEIAHGCIQLDGVRYPNEDDVHFISHARQQGDIEIDGEKRGFVEVAYDRSKPTLDEGPFLKEERNLIDAIARQIAMVVQRRQTAEERERLREQLRHADRLATIGQLASGVAHELNEPLANVLGLAQLALKSASLHKDTERDLQNIVKASLHAREVIKKLMLFARQTPPQVVESDLNQLVEDGLYFLASRCAKEGIELNVEFAPHLPTLRADPSQMHQVLVNLVVNALQSMNSGDKLSIRTRRQEDDIILEVEDTGAGIEEEIRHNIFVPFFTTKDVDQGTGLGLSVVHGIVTAHKGTIEVKSVKGEGTTFTVRFPSNSYQKDER